MNITTYPIIDNLSDFPYRVPVVYNVIATHKLAVKGNISPYSLLIGENGSDRRLQVVDTDLKTYVSPVLSADQMINWLTDRNYTILP